MSSSDTPVTAGPSPAATCARIAEQVAELDSVAERPLAEHAEMYQLLHMQLQDALAEIDGP